MKVGSVANGNLGHRTLRYRKGAMNLTLVGIDMAVMF